MSALHRAPGIIIETEPQPWDRKGRYSWPMDCLQIPLFVASGFGISASFKHVRARDRKERTPSQFTVTPLTT